MRVCVYVYIFTFRHTLNVTRVHVCVNVYVYSFRHTFNVTGVRICVVHDDHHVLQTIHLFLFFLQLLLNCLKSNMKCLLQQMLPIIYKQTATGINSSDFTGTAINNVTQTSHHSSSTVTITTTSSPQDSEYNGRPMVTNSPATSSTNTPPYTTHASSQNTPDRDSNVSTRAAITHTMGHLVSSPVVDSWTAVVYIPNPDTMFLTDTHVMYFEYCSNKDGAVYLQIYRPTKGHNYVLYSSVYHKAENAGYHKVEVRGDLERP